MSLSPIAVAQREKEAKSLNAFLAFSLIGSLALHIGVLSLGLGKFLSKAPEVENEPIEIAIVEVPTPQKLEKVKTDSVAGNDRAILSNSGGSEGFGVSSNGGASLPKKIAPTNSSISTAEVIKAQSVPQRKPSQRISRAISTPAQNQKIKLENAPTKIVTQPKLVVNPNQFAPAKPLEAPTQTAPSEIVTQPKPVIAPSPIAVARAKPTAETSKDRSAQIQQLNNRRLDNLLANAKTVREQASTVSNSSEIKAQQGKIATNLRSQSGSGTGTSNGLGNSTGSESRNSSARTGNGTGNGTSINNGGNGNGTGRGTGNGTSTTNGGIGKGNNGLQSGSTVATGTRNVERNISPAASESNPNTGVSSGRLACRTCSKPKYPENARKRKLEGKAEISVDVDSKGNVTNVRLAQTSGHAELDKAAVEQARNWKFNTPNGSAQGVTAKVDFAIEGSKRSRQNRERRRQRAATRTQSVANGQNTRAKPSTQTTPITNTNTALRRSLRRQSTTVRRRVEPLPRLRQQPVGQTKLRDSLRRSQRATSPNQNRLRRSPPQATSPNQTKLRQSLRLYKQQSGTNSNEP